MKLVGNQMFMMTVVTGIVGMGFGFMVMIFTLQLTTAGKQFVLQSFQSVCFV